MITSLVVGVGFKNGRMLLVVYNCVYALVVDVRNLVCIYSTQTFSVAVVLLLRS